MTGPELFLPDLIIHFSFSFLEIEFMVLLCWMSWPGNSECVTKCLWLDSSAYVRSKVFYDP